MLFGLQMDKLISHQRFGFTRVCNLNFQRFSVFLSGPPYIVSPPENVTVNISQNALFTCQAEAYPGNLTYTWFWEEDNVYFKK